MGSQAGATDGWSISCDSDRHRGRADLRVDAEDGAAAEEEGRHKGGPVYGKTDADGHKGEEGEMKSGDLFATIFSALGIDYEKEYHVGSRSSISAASRRQKCWRDPLTFEPCRFDHREQQYHVKHRPGFRLLREWGCRPAPHSEATDTRPLSHQRNPKTNTVVTVHLNEGGAMGETGSRTRAVSDRLPGTHAGKL